MKKSRYRMAFDTVLVLLVIVFFVSIYTFILQRDYSKAMVEATVARDEQCSDAIHKLVSDKFTKEDFETIVSKKDMSTERYRELQKQLNDLRSLNSTRYLYTAKRGADGKLIYLVDGLDLGADDFAYPGTYIEDEMIPYIESALSGKTVYSQEIVDTTWGHIFTACYPVNASEDSDEIIGALCMEMDMESAYNFIAQSNKKTVENAVVAIVVLLALAVLIVFRLHKQKQEEKQQQKVLEDAVTAADAANKAKSTFLFNMSHDIRTPMNAILGFSELAKQNTSETDKNLEYLDKIQVSGKRMLEIIDNVLEMSKIESGKMELLETAVESGSILDACVTMVQPEVDKKELTLMVTKEKITPYIYLDNACVTEIVLNLVSNSIKYTKPGGWVHCAIRQTESEKPGYVVQELSVSDNGVGMSKEFQAHIYDSFSRERSSTVSGVEGTGLGMGIVKKLVDMLHGTITLKSELGKGTTFIVRFPCRIAQYEDVIAQSADQDVDQSLLKGKRLLLAEDNDLNAEIAMAMLSDVGLLVDRVENGVECIDRLDHAPEHYYSLILMDVQMPVLDGYQTTEKIRQLADKEKAAIPIVAMTANAFEEDKKEALQHGMNEHAAKPIDMNKLIPILLKYM